MSTRSTLCACGGKKDRRAAKCLPCSKRLWTPEDDARLRTMVEEGIEYRAMGRKLGRSEYACRSRSHFLGCRLSREAILANRAKGRQRFYNDPKKVERRRKRHAKKMTPEARAIFAEEARQRNRAGTFGVKHHRPEVRAKISAAHKGRKLSAEHRRKISEARKLYWFIRKGGSSIKTHKAQMIPYRPLAPKLENIPSWSDAAPEEEELLWCAQCDRRVSADRIANCASQFCKVKPRAA